MRTGAGDAPRAPRAASAALLVAAFAGACGQSTRAPSVETRGGEGSAASASAAATAPEGGAPPGEPASAPAASGATASVDHELSDVTAIGISRGLACAVRVDGSVWCWSDRCDPQPLVARRVTPAGFPPAADIAMGPCFSCARTGAGAVSCWDDQGAPPVVDAIALPGAAAKVVVAQRAGFARLDDGRVLTWGATEAGFTRASATDLRQPPNIGAGWKGECHGKSDTTEWWGGCQQDEHGAVRCQGSGGSVGGMSTRQLPVSDDRWRAVPWLSGATDLGADDHCAWGLVAPDRVRRDCVYGDFWTDEECPANDGCPITKKSTYQTTGSSFFRIQSEYPFPGIKRLVDQFVGLDGSGQCLAFDGHRLVPAMAGRYRDVVAGERALYGLRADGKVRQLCDASKGEGEPVLARAP